MYQFENLIENILRLHNIGMFFLSFSGSSECWPYKTFQKILHSIIHIPNIWFVFKLLLYSYHTLFTYQTFTVQWQAVTHVTILKINFEGVFQAETYYCFYSGLLHTYAVVDANAFLEHACVFLEHIPKLF